MNLFVLPTHQSFIPIHDTQSARRFIELSGEFLGNWGNPLQVYARSSLDEILRMLHTGARFDSLVEEKTRISLHIFTQKERSQFEISYRNEPHYTINHGHLHIIQKYGDGLWTERLYLPLATRKGDDIGCFDGPR